MADSAGSLCSSLSLIINETSSQLHGYIFFQINLIFTQIRFCEILKFN